MHHLGLLPGTKDALHGFSPDELNAHFVGVSLSPLEDIDAASIFEEASAGGFAFRPVGLGDVELAVKNFFSQAYGEDGIPQSVISKALPFIGPHVVKLFNASFSQGIFPETWRRARPLTLKKVSVPFTPSDFRPIALLCFLSKVLEKLAHDQSIYINQCRNTV